MTFPLFPTPFGAKFPTSKLLPRFRFLLFLPLPSLYLLFSKPSPLDFFSVIAFSAVLFTSLNFALSFFTRLFPTKFSSSSSSPHPVVWSIGSNPKQVKNTNWGCWVQVYSKWDVYEGEFQKGKCWGSGVYHYNMHGRYEGDWVDGKYDGYGVETWARGSRYRGQYREGLRHGMGIYCHGLGVHTCIDGSRYVGEFKRGVKHGLGQYHFRQDAWFWSVSISEWSSNGILEDPKRHNSPTGSPCAVDHTKVSNAVQDAHSAAEKAYNMAKVDGGVNKVVAVANKAANTARVAAVKAVQNRMHHK
ncbi:Phosphatidylinositol-4-phosphate 5-kinase 8 [Glycine soja]|uniref:Phosphatidylinositol-4-phosphate 5-kinase 8 n=1 Tax=Glycine soja TaxID=3848 RepID=A0A0B2PGA4_GLYSO|nr:Phosphatidylinositol-4-phosphate 5-kinase 8 [Glycine soja]